MEAIRVLHENVIMDPGGIETLLMNIYRHIDREKVQFDFMVHRSNYAFYDKEIEQLGGRIYRTPKFCPFPKQYSEYICGMRRVIYQHPEYKIIHAHSELNLWPLKIAKEMGVPIRIAHSHNSKTKINLKYCFFLYERANIRKYCTDMFMCSKDAGEWSFGKQALTNNEAILIKNGIETDKFDYNENIRKQVRDEFGLNNKLVVGHVGRFMEQKNHKFLIEVFKAIHELNSNTVLMLVGDGKLFDSINKLAIDLGIYNSVIFLKKRNDVNRLMQAMDIFVFPSLWEGLGIVAVEAQTAGLPVFISDAIPSEVVLTDNVFITPLKLSAKAWAEKILSISLTHERKSHKNEIAKAGYDICNTAQLLQNFYLEKQLRYGNI